MEVFFITLPSLRDYSIKVFDIYGRIRFEENYSSIFKAAINLQNQPDGLYILEIMSGNFRVYKNIQLLR